MESDRSNPGAGIVPVKVEVISRRPRFISWYASHAEPEEFGNALMSAVLWLAVWVYASFAVLSSFPAPVDSFDDPIPLVHGMWIQKGHTPNLDFYSFYPPLGLYLNAALFTLLGKTVLAIRALGGVLYFLLLFMATRYFRFRFPYPDLVAPAAMLLLVTAIGTSIARPAWPGFAVSILALLTYLFSQGRVRNRLWVVGVSGLLTGLAVLYRINFGGYVIMVVALDLLVPWLPRGGATRSRLCLKEDLLTAVVFLGPLSLVCAAFCFWVYGRSAVTAVVGLVIQAQRMMAVGRFIEIPFSMSIGCAVALPAGWFFVRMLLGVNAIPLKAFVPPAFALALLSIALVGRTRVSVVAILVALEIATVLLLHLWIYRLDRSEFCLLLFVCGLLHYYISRADWPHLSLLLIAEALLLPFLEFSRADLTSEHRSSLSRGTAIAVLLTASFLCFASTDLTPPAAYVPKGMRLLGTLLRHPHLTDTGFVLGSAAPDEAWLTVYPDVDELRALRFLRASTTSSDAIFSGVPDHSAVAENNLRIYWLADRPIGVRTFQLETRMATEAPIQQGIIADLERNDVKWVIIDSNSLVPDATFKVHPYVGSKLLDQYIASHYSEEARFGAYVVLRKISAG